MNPKKIPFSKLWLTIVLISCGACPLFGQEISGRVLLADGSPIDMATVVVRSAQDSTLIKGEITDIDGTFGIPISEPGAYLVQVSYIGYSEFMSAPVQFTGRDITLPDIVLEESSYELEAVTVEARKPLIVVRADRTIFNTEGNIASTGSNGLELLRKAPGVMLDNDDNIALRGRSGVLIYLDGKQSFLEPQELANLMRSLSATDIESIEIITNPSARYDASGNAGIINIITKKGKGMGTNGTLTATSGFDEKFKNSVSVNLNHRMRNLNLYGGGSLGHNQYVSSLRARRSQDGRYFDQSTENFSESAPVNAKLGLDYAKGTKHSFGALATINSNMGDRRNTTNSTTDIANGEDLPIDSLLLANSVTESNFINASTNFNYRFRDSLGNDLAVDVNRGWYRTDSNNDQPNTYTDLDGNILNTRNFRTETQTDIDIYTGKIDYEHRFTDTGISISAGGKYARVDSDNDFDFFNEMGETYEIDADQSNQFRYLEEVAATYFNTMIPFNKKLMIQAGLRWEHTHSIGDLQRFPGQPTQAEDRVERNYDSWFPSAAMTYDLNESHGFALSYSRRIDRPVYATLNPFEIRIDAISFRRGNPFLNPQFSNNFELKYILKGTTTFGLSYSKSKDNIVNIIEPDRDSPDRIFVNFRNLADRTYYAFDMSTPTRFAHWWTGYVNLTAFQSKYLAEFDEFSYNITSPISLNVFVQQSFTLGNGWTYEISGRYSSKTVSDNGFEVIPLGSLDMGIQKKVLNDKGTIKLSYSDLLGTANWGGTNDAVDALRVQTTTDRETQIIQLSLNYRFGSSSVTESSRRSTGAEEERNRIN